MATYGELEFRQIGYLAADPSFRKNGDQKVVNFRVLTNEVWKDKATQEERSRVEGFNYELWGEGAEHFAERMKKGRRVYVVGQPRNDSYEKEPGVTQYGVRIRVSRWQDLGAPSQDADGKSRQDAGGAGIQEGEAAF
ncbi:single-stranded DNA-binding protein (plasmid) [Burkholderia vietnamiensis]|uniref:Single-stranded DNA-binding protein n=1 Tax=Burkholderia vietnamiensis (strain G4 / LMG 22486) TaxID=269482 RepID=A4JV78_BURVG|nr:single-strand binding protein [Burkholderia vietnamiensis G4]MCB4349369.1 single-stranded DNA-binding protein [Burkholderia vietnamiensis]